MSLPWGGMLYIGEPSSADLSIKRFDEYGLPYYIKYRANTDRRIYSPPHRTHRDGRHLDLSLYSVDENGNNNGSIYESALYDMGDQFFFTVVLEGNHYHITHKAWKTGTLYGSASYGPYKYFPYELE